MLEIPAWIEADFFGLLLVFDQTGTSGMEIKEYLRSGLNFTFCMGRLHVPPRHGLL